MPRRHFILTAIGRDRPGIVADLAEMVFQQGCNLEDSSMVNLGSEFSTMVLISGQGDDLQARLHMACKHLEYEKGMTIFIKPVDEGSSPASPRDGRPYKVRAMGEDKAGIVARTARVLASAGGNILQLASRVNRAAGSGTPLYELDIRCDLPARADVKAIEKSLQAIEDELNVEITIAPA